MDSLDVCRKLGPLSTERNVGLGDVQFCEAARAPYIWIQPKGVMLQLCNYQYCKIEGEKSASHCRTNLVNEVEHGKRQLKSVESDTDLVGGVSFSAGKFLGEF